jgi:hypothetical protein
VDIGGGKFGITILLRNNDEDCPKIAKTNMTAFFQSLEHTWTRDMREPLFTFELQDETWGFYGMSLMAWNLMLAVSEGEK